jgi:prolyl oligopeptidase
LCTRCENRRALQGVSTVQQPEQRPTLQEPDDDPYLWLEEIDGSRALAWVEAQNAATLQRFGDKGFATDRDVLKAIFDRREVE